MKAIPRKKEFKVGSRQEHYLYITHLVKPKPENYFMMHWIEKSVEGAAGRVPAIRLPASLHRK